MGVQLTGDWKKAMAIFDNIEHKYDQAIKRGLSRCGIYLVGQLKKGIRNQKPGGKGYEPLHPFTIARKGSKKAMIDDGDFINAMNYKVEGKEVFVGVLRTAKDKKGKPLVNLARIHEEGIAINVTKKMRGFLASQGLHLKPTTQVITIPARPTFGPVWEAEKANIVSMIEQEIQKSLFGG